ncbi:uncharacterized protein Tco025E_07267 [Trypanosoma conorhini]|uniref:Trans-sialidase n=1 Tax=Trypanosoma conorhini TaxID=83891 RepID=A0A422NRQ0_9TRYP|nr:uncharacterized protein Tco025E_07267 [Trypanosoma conorhini]RNF08157.1 hypothetical protein Tco025E_07267 [Trypanosoma conorhini]
MAALPAVRRRVACALAILAVLGCCPPACVTTAAASSAQEGVNESVLILRAGSGAKLSLRRSAGSAWRKRTFSVKALFALSGTIGGRYGFLCARAWPQYQPLGPDNKLSPGSLAEALLRSR